MASCDLQRKVRLKLLQGFKYGNTTGSPVVLNVLIDLATGSVKMLLTDFPGSPIKMGQPKFKTTTHLPIFQDTFSLEGIRCRVMLSVVSPIRSILADPAATADSPVLENKILLSLANLKSMQHNSLPSSMIAYVSAEPTLTLADGDLDLRRDCF